MGGASEPYMYCGDNSSRGSRFPTPAFDPKSVTRASWEPKPVKPRQDGPLVSFNRHPDAHMVLTHRSNDFSSMSPGTKKWIRFIRRFQIALRLLELNAAIGLLVLLILITHVDAVTAWILRIMSGIVILYCVYGVYHLSRDAASRAPASSAAYQIFAALTDLVTLGIYGFGAFAVHSQSSTWKTSLDPSTLEYLVPALYYTFIGAGGLHLVSLSVSFWLALMFRKISLMPPDMNPLEDHLTARPKHKRNKSSMTMSSMTESEKRLSTPLESRYRSGQPYEDISRPPSIPFMHTRTQSRDSMASSKKSWGDLGHREYQIVPGNSSRQSLASVEPKRLSATPLSQRGSYVSLPHHDQNSPDRSSMDVGQRRPAKFTETWMPTDSLISRTNHRNRELAAAQTSRHALGSKSYSALASRYDLDVSSDSESEYNDENALASSSSQPNLTGKTHPHPLGSNPMPLSSKGSPARAPAAVKPHGRSLNEINPNHRAVSGSRDIADLNYGQRAQPDEPLYSLSYGNLKSATPPIMIGDKRKVSSGNDYSSSFGPKPYGRRNVSGKVAEEGLAGAGYSRPKYLSSYN